MLHLQHAGVVHAALSKTALPPSALPNPALPSTAHRDDDARQRGHQPLQVEEERQLGVLGGAHFQPRVVAPIVVRAAQFGGVVEQCGLEMQGLAPRFEACTTRPARGGAAPTSCPPAASPNPLHSRDCLGLDFELGGRQQRALAVLNANVQLRRARGNGSWAALQNRCPAACCLKADRRASLPAPRQPPTWPPRKHPTSQPAVYVASPASQTAPRQNPEPTCSFSMVELSSVTSTCAWAWPSTMRMLRDTWRDLGGGGRSGNAQHSRAGGRAAALNSRAAEQSCLCTK